MINYTQLPNVLVGTNAFYIHHSTFINKETQLDFSPEWTSRPIAGTLNVNPREFPRSSTTVFVESNDEAKKELFGEYNHKSMMSLDGIFSPISFYPTAYSSTFHITKYPTPNCPFCFGTKTYQYGAVQDDARGGGSVDACCNATISANNLQNATQQKSRPCPFCEEVQSKKNREYVSVSPKEIMPPYIVATGSDLTILANMTGHGGLTGVPIINYATLNPITLTTGEFSNFQNKQSGDYCGHTIDLISFGMIPPREGDGLRPSYNHRIERSYTDYDMNVIDWRDNMIRAGVTIPSIPPLANNMRFFGLRGPIMLHGWGYDIEGYPVPNSSGEPLVNIVNGNPVVVRDSNNNIVGKNQTFKNGEWTKPYKENTFYKGWAQQPGTWPVGPIDLRWDAKAGVWTVPSNYKAVHILIEEDLVGTNPARGSMVNDSDDNDPLPDGFRKLLFVKDNIGTYSAPRGAVLYCKYNSNNGFYEPVGFQPFITSGIIASHNTVEIFNVYTKPNNPTIRLSDDPNVEKYTTTYKNPLKYSISVGDIGLFTYIDGSWVLQSFNPAS